MAGMYGDVRDVARAADFAQRARDSAAQYEIRTLEVESQAMYSEFCCGKATGLERRMLPLRRWDRTPS